MAFKLSLKILLMTLLGIGVMTSPVWFSTAVQGSVSNASPGPAFTLRHDPCERYYALTFDDGPFPGHTEKLVALLDQAGAPATFFNTGQHAQDNPDLVRLERTVGVIGGHSWGHDDYTKLHPSVVRSDVERTHGVVNESKFFRPPYGASNAAVRKEIRDAGLIETMWTVDTLDWQDHDTQSMVGHASKVQDGGILLLHDGWPSTLKALPLILNDLRARGLCPGVLKQSRTPQIMGGLSEQTGAATDALPYPFNVKAVKP